MVFLPRSRMCAEAAENPPAETAGCAAARKPFWWSKMRGPVRELVCNLLAGHGYHILQAESGLRALDILAGKQGQH